MRRQILAIFITFNRITLDKSFIPTYFVARVDAAHSRMFNVKILFDEIISYYTRVRGRRRRDYVCLMDLTLLKSLSSSSTRTRTQFLFREEEFSVSRRRFL